MKKIKFFSLLLFVLISFFSCASSKVVVKDSLFDDWRYKGFGS